MKKCIRYQWSIMIHSEEFKLAFSIMFILTVFSYLRYVFQYWGSDVNQVITGSDLQAINAISNIGGVLPYVLSLVIVLPFSTSYIVDRNYNNENFVLHRCNKDTYLLSKMVVCFVGGLLIVLVPFLINTVLCKVTFFENLNYWYGSYGTQNYVKNIVGTNQLYKSVNPVLPFMSLYLRSPWLYSLLYIIMLSIFSGLLSIFVLFCSFWTKRYKILLFLPVYMIVRFLRVLDTASFSAAMASEKNLYLNYNIMDYFIPQSFHGQSVLFAMVFIGLMVLFCAVSYMRERKREWL